MADITRHDGHHARSRDLSHAVDGHLQLTLDHLIDFFLRMEVLVNGGAAREVVMRECHARRMEVASMPAWQTLNNLEAAGVDKRHKVFSVTRVLQLHRVASGVRGPLRQRST